MGGRLDWRSAGVERPMRGGECKTGRGRLHTCRAIAVGVYDSGFLNPDIAPQCGLGEMLFRKSFSLAGGGRR